MTFDVADYGNDIQAAINAAASSKGTVIADAGIYTISGLTMAEGVRLELSQSAVMNLNQDAHGITLAKNSQISGGILSITGSFSSAALYFPGSEQFGVEDELCIVERMRLRNGNHEGYGIYMDADDGYITFCHLRDISIDRFDNGIRLETKDPASGSNFVNGNIFSGITMKDCKYFVNMVMATPSASDESIGSNTLMNFQMQTGAWAEKALYCDGRQNMIYGFVVWDWYRAAGTPPTEGNPGELGLSEGMYFSADSRQNHVHTTMPKHRLINYGWNNAIFSTYIQE